MRSHLPSVGVASSLRRRSLQAARCAVKPMCQQGVKGSFRTDRQEKLDRNDRIQLLG